MEYTEYIKQVANTKTEVHLMVNDVESYVKDYVDMEIDKFLGLYYFVSKTDMYGAACSLATYVKVSPYGVNTFNSSGLGGSGRYQIDYADNFLPENTVGNNDVRNKQINDFFNKTAKKKKTK